MVPCNPAPLLAPRVHTAHPVLLPSQAHRHPVDGEVDVAHHRALFDLGRPSTTGAAHLANDLFDYQLDVGSPALEAHDRDVFETH